MPDVTQALRDTRDLLLVANHDNQKALGDFGCEMDSPHQTRVRSKCVCSPTHRRGRDESHGTIFWSKIFWTSDETF
jgi:hypothetical protein